MLLCVAFLLDIYPKCFIYDITTQFYFIILCKFVLLCVRFFKPSADILHYECLTVNHIPHVCLVCCIIFINGFHHLPNVIFC